MWQQPFFEVALPIIITFVLATWYQSSRITDLRESPSKRIDDLRGDMNARFNNVNARIGGVEKRLEGLEDRVEGRSEAGVKAD